MASWPDIPGVTAVGGRARLPRAPDAVVQVLVTVLDASVDGASWGEVADRAVRAARIERGRVEGLLGWLPSSRMVRWSDAARLEVDGRTDLVDLAIRYSAWVSTQPVPREFAESARTYAVRITELAGEGPTRSQRYRRGGARLPVVDVVGPSVVPEPGVPLRDRLREPSIRCSWSGGPTRGPRC
jgi:hypothetical protein